MEPDSTYDEYFYELSLLDNFSEFHPDWFSSLSEHNRHDLVDYYAWNVDTDSVLAWREEKTKADPDLSIRASVLLANILGENGVSTDRPRND